MLKIEYIHKDELKTYANNAKLHTAEQVEQIKRSIQGFGFNDPIAVWKDNEIIEGHGRLLAAMELDIDTVPVIRLDNLTDEQRRAYMLAHNKVNMNTDFDLDLLEIELDNITEFDMSEFGFDLDDDDFSVNLGEEHKKLSDDYIIPPFDVFDARKGDWLDRKRLWNDKIGDTGQARDDAKAMTTEHIAENYGMKSQKGTSILDPVLSEVILKWFTPYNNCNCFDCFAGDTVFGYVSSYLGHNFTGIELRQEQVDFNTQHTDGLPCKYICDDGRNVSQHIGAETQDLLFSCPPYYDLEVYSDLENDASNQETYEDFYNILDTAFTNAIGCLKENRFAVIVCPTSLQVIPNGRSHQSVVASHVNL